jgi:hypothetical protein
MFFVHGKKYVLETQSSEKGTRMLATISDNGIFPIF